MFGISSKLIRGVVGVVVEVVVVVVLPLVLVLVVVIIVTYISVCDKYCYNITSYSKKLL